MIFLITISFFSNIIRIKVELKDTVIFYFCKKRILVGCSLIVNDRCERIKVAALSAMPRADKLD